jgi:hypothetical protein
MKKYIVSEGLVGLLYEDGAFVRLLKPGKHKLRKHLLDRTHREVRLIENVKLTVHAEREKAKMRLESELRGAQALAENPSLLKLRQLDVLRAMAESGAKFVVGLEGRALEGVLDDER